MSDPPIRLGHEDRPADDSCGCCTGTALSTLRATDNRPNLSAIAFRVGTHASFKASMLTGLASAAYPALARLGTRADDDFSIALIDAWASTCEVLSFYQERLANEAYLGTATERLSLNELARLIGYRLHPGSAAETELVILMENPPAAPPDVTDLSVHAGTRVQSQPGPEETPQVFETLDELNARVAWNTLRPRLTRAILPRDGDRSTWVSGTPNLQVGDAILFLGRERWDTDYSGFQVNTLLWDFRRVTAVEAAADGSRSRLSWDRALDSVDSGSNGPTAGLKLLQLRDRAALFGYNAPHPVVLTNAQRNRFGYVGSAPANSPSPITGNSSNPGDWLFEFSGTRRIQLDNLYKSYVQDSWIVLQAPNAVTQPFRIDSARDDTLARFAISGKAQRLNLDTDANFPFFEDAYRAVTVYGGSSEIALAETPLDTWIAGNLVELDQRVDELPAGRRLIFRGRRAMLRYDGQVASLTHEDGAVRALLMGAIVSLLDAPETSGVNLRYRLMDETGFVGSVVLAEGLLTPVPAPDDQEQLTIAATLDQVIASDSAHSTLKLTDSLGVAFDRASLVIYANVVRSAHGEGVSEILGGGDPAQAMQRFALRQSPVTYRQAATERGVQSTLRIRVDGVEWQEVEDLYQRGPQARVYRTSLSDDGTTVVEFGDGESGARPPPGRDNIVAEHSRGLGRAGNLRAGQLTLPLDRPLGMKETLNPLPASGGADPEPLDAARRNIPIYTLTLGRVVSLTDYRDYALGFPGIAKADAHWVWQGETRRIVVTVAGDEGEPIGADSTTYKNLLQAFHTLGDPLVGVDLLSFDPAFFRLGLRVAVNTAYDTDSVLAATESELRSRFAFQQRDFGQFVSLSEVAAAAHRVDGLDAVDIDLLYRSSGPQQSHTAHSRLLALGARLGAGGQLLPAEILTLHNDPLAQLELMP